MAGCVSAERAGRQFSLLAHVSALLNNPLNYSLTFISNKYFYNLHLQISKRRAEVPYLVERRKKRRLCDQSSQQLTATASFLCRCAFMTQMSVNIAESLRLYGDPEPPSLVCSISVQRCSALMFSRKLQFPVCTPFLSCH